MSTTIVLGSNRFVDCQAILGIREQVLLRVAVSPLRVTLQIPPGLRSGRTVSINENVIAPSTPGSDNLRIVAGEMSVAIFWKETALLLATLLDTETVHLKVDLRPLGINVYDDVSGLHVGRNTLARNSFSNCPTAIGLA